MYIFFFHALKIEIVNYIKHYQLISLFGIHIAEEPVPDDLKNVDLFFEAKYLKLFRESC